jgi:hypothetical protein
LWGEGYFHGTGILCKRPRKTGAKYFEREIYIAVGLRMTPNKNAITAITNSTCIRLPAAVKNTPIAQPMMRITAIIYNNEFMVDNLKCFINSVLGI